MGPIRGQTRPLPVTAGIEPQKIDAKLNSSIHNRFDIEIINSETGEVRQRAQAENVICDYLWTLMFPTDGVFTSWNKFIHIGKGTGTPSAADTSLFTFLGSKEAVSESAVLGTAYLLDNEAGLLTLKRKITLSEKEYVGHTITEVGIGAGTSSNTLCTHAMLKDANGNQISIIKTGTDIINIYSTIFAHWSTSGISNIAHCLFNSQYDAFAMWLLGIGTSSPIPEEYFYSGHYAGSGLTKSNQLTMDLAHKKITATASRIASTEGNFEGGINSIMCPPFALSLASSYPVTGESIATGDGSTKDFFTDFRIASAASVYVNGVVDSTVTIDVGVPASIEIGPYFILCVASGVQYPYYNARFAGGANLSKGDTIYAYNPNYFIGIKNFAFTNDNHNAVFDIYASDDFVTWAKVNSSAVEAAYAYCKYWKAVCVSDGWSNSVSGVRSLASGNVHFATAPANGAVITGEYTTDVIPKDVNNVYDFALSVQLGEHTT